MTTAQDFFNRLDMVEDIPTLPMVAMNVNRLLEDYDTSISDLATTIEKDQAIVAKILKLVNSSFYGFRSCIDSIARAVVVLGFDTVRNAVLAVSVMDAFTGARGAATIDLVEFWRHSVAVAVTSRHLGMLSCLESPGRCFVGGLLHDMGKVVMAQHCPVEFAQILALTADGELSFVHAEQEVLPVDHARVGGYLAEKWLLPESLRQVIRFHHTPERMDDGCPLGMIVNAADVIVNESRRRGEVGLSFRGMNGAALEALRPQIDDAHDWYPELEEKIGEACRFFVEEGR